MSAETFYIKQGDRLPPIEAILRDGDGNAVEPELDDTVVFSMRNTRTDVVKVSRQPATVVDGTPRRVRYSWQATDTDTSGNYEAEWEWLNGGLPQTFPNYDGADGSPTLLVVIADDIA